MIIVRPQSEATRRRSAFTLLEVLVVVAIILVLASVSTVAVLNIQESNKADIARLKAKTIESAVKIYITRNDGNFPSDLSQVVPLIEGNAPDKLLDPWGGQYSMQMKTDDAGNQSFYIHCTSPKGQEIRSDVKNQ